jgi:multiple sugar transport system ATP-binding protein
MRKTPPDEIDLRVRDAAGIMDIESLLDRLPRQLSGGERQRVALGRAIVRRPTLFLLDEPLSNLDALLRIHMRTELIKLHKELGTTAIYVTHDQVEAMTMGSRIAVMNRGRLQQLGTPGQIYDEPANLFVAGFFGSPPMNFIPVTLKRDSGTPVYTSDDLSIELKLSQQVREFDTDEYEDGSSLILGVRPEAIRLGDGSNDSSRSLLPARAKIEVIEPLGHESIIYVSIGCHSLATRAESAEGLAIGDVVPAYFDQRKLQLFDPSTEQSLLKIDG